MLFFRKKIKNALCIILTTLFMLTALNPLFITTLAAGSTQLNVDDDGYRFYTEYFNRDSAGLTRKTIVKCYLMRGETAYFGSSVADSRMNLEGTDVVKENGVEVVTGNDIVVTYPDGSMHPFDVIDSEGNQKGYIANSTQEKNGPRLGEDDEDDITKYDPHSFTANVEGIYTFEFHSQRGVYSGLAQATPSKVSTLQDQKNFAVAYWDITVANDRNVVKEGRTWTTLLALTTGAAYNIRANLEVFVLTNDGYIYKVNFNDIIPYGFTFFANNMGFTTTDKVPYSIYHSFYDNDNSLNNTETEELVTVHKPYMPDTELAQSFKIFFEKPNEDLIGKVYNEPSVVEPISSLTFHGVMKTIGTAHVGQGGYFTFNSKGATSATITIDFRDSIDELIANGDFTGPYTGSGIVELSGAVTDGENYFPWNGKDTEGVAIPAGVYGKNKINAVSESKSGEVHFPFIDVEGLSGGVVIERLTNTDGKDDAFDIYYNNNPLAYNTIEYDTINNQPYTPTIQGTSAILTDGTKTMSNGKASTTATSGTTAYGGMYFETLTQNNNKKIEYEDISTLRRDTPDYLYNKEHGEGSWERLSQTEKDAFTQECESYLPTFHHEPNDSRKHTIVFDNPAGSNTDGGGNQAGIDIWTYYSDGVRNTGLKSDMQILEAENVGKITGRVFYDENSNRQFDISGTDYPIRDVTVQLVDKFGNPITTVENRPVFDNNGNFARDEDGKIVYEPQELTYTTTTDKYGVYTFTGVPIIDGHETEYFVQVRLSYAQVMVENFKLTTTSLTGVGGPDGNVRDSKGLATLNNNETVFKLSNSQSVTISKENPEAEYKDIGYVSVTPATNQMNYRVVKRWPKDGTERLSSITIKLYHWDSKAANVNSRSGGLIETVKLSAANNWSYTWRHLDKTQQYYFVEYYTKTDANGNTVYNDKGEEILVLIGGTMPLYSAAPNNNENPKYSFTLDNETEARNKEYFSDEVVHQDATTEAERNAQSETNALQYKVTYELRTDMVSKTNIATITNDQTYDEREYYVWLNHESELPNFVQTTLGTGVDENGQKIVDVKNLKTDSNGNILGMKVTTVDGAVNTDGNATSEFLYDSNNKTSTKYTAKVDDSFPEGTGTRTYKVEFIDPDDSSGHKYSWDLTIHVYDLTEDTYVLDYGLKARLQQSQATKDTKDYEYMLLSNDVFRVGRYKTMSTCADITGIAYSPNGVVSDEAAKSLDWQDTVSEGSTDGTAQVQGKNGTFSINLETKRTEEIPNGQDHATYATVDFEPTDFMSDIDVFYYKVIVYGEYFPYQNTAYDKIDATNGVIMYVPVRVMPANVVYYEDGYRFSTKYSKNNFEVVTDNNAVVTADNGYQSINQDEIYGYDSAYLDPENVSAGQYDSLGSSTNIEARSSNFTFTFTGTGYDILGRTDSTASRITYRIEKYADDGTKKLLQGGTVDASYVDTNSSSLYQLPVISVKDLEYGKYSVTATLITTTTGSYHFNLDGIRIYNPLGSDGSEYYIDRERKSETYTIRDMILGSVTEEQLADGFAPTDAIASIIYSETNNGSYVVGSTVTEIRSSSTLVNHSEDLADYLSAGPKGELYIPSGSGIAFIASDDGASTYKTLQIEAKAIYEGNDTDADNSGYGFLENVGSSQIINVDSSSSMYYELETTHLSKNGNLVIIVNNSDWTVSVSNLKVKGYNISFPSDFVKTAEQAGLPASSSDSCDTWGDNIDGTIENVRVSNANFATSYARAGRDIYLNETVVELYNSDKAARYMPLVIDPNGNVIQLSDDDIIPVRNYKTNFIDKDGKSKIGNAFVYKIKITAPEAEGLMQYSVGAISRSKLENTDAFGYSFNAWDVSVTVKSGDINVTLKTQQYHTSSGRTVLMSIASDESITTEDTIWAQRDDNTIYSEWTESGPHSVVIKDADGYESTVEFNVEFNQKTEHKVTPLAQKLIDFFNHILQRILSAFAKKR